MNEKNLGVCFAPSLFHLCGTKEDPSSPKRQKRTPMNKASKELTDNLVSAPLLLISNVTSSGWQPVKIGINNFPT